MVRTDVAHRHHWTSLLERQPPIPSIGAVDAFVGCRHLAELTLRPKTTIRARLVLIAAAMCAAAAGLVGFSSVVIQPQIDGVSRDHAVLASMGGLTESAIQAVLSQELRLDDYLFTGSTEELAGYHAAVAAEAGIVARLREAAVGEPGVLVALDALAQAGEAWRSAYADPIIAEAPTASPAARRALGARAHDHDSTVVAAAGLRDEITQLESRLIARESDLERVRSLDSVLMVIVFSGGVVLGLWLLNLWIARPIRGLVDTAARVEAGEDLAFSAGENDEIGRLGAALERMRGTLSSGAARATVLNRFTEVTLFAANDTEVARFSLDALDLLLSPDGAVTHVLNHSKDRATPEASFGAAEAEVLALHSLERCPGVVRGTVYVTPDLAAPLSVHCPVLPKAGGTLVCAPLEHGELVGATHLWWERRDAFSQDDTTTVMRLAEHAALAIGNRRLLAALRGMAATDAKTGLANPRALEEALERAIRMRAAGESIGLLMLDLDHFKDLNDRHGHPAGDEALRNFALILRACTREGDLVARYGGEEFVVVLPQTGADVAVSIAERIRIQTEATLLRLGPGITDHLTVSVGVALAPDHAVDAVALLRAADEALYQAKQTGRNRTVTLGRPTAPNAPGSLDEAPGPRLPVRARRSASP